MKTLIFSFLTVLPLMCGSNQSDYNDDYVSSPDAYYAEEAMAEKINDNFDEAKVVSDKVIKTAHMTLETQDLDKTKQQISELNKKHQGTITNQTEGTGYNRIEVQYTIRIPSAKFDDWINDLSAFYNYFDQKNISANDVTEEYMDVSSRIKNKKALESRYLELLQKTQNINDILSIERELNVIREEIERQEGRLNYLKDRISQSTINLLVYKSTPNLNSVKQSYGNKILSSIKGGWNVLLNLILGVLYLWPLFLILIFVIIFIKRKRRAKNEKN